MSDLKPRPRSATSAQIQRRSTPTPRQNQAGRNYSVQSASSIYSRATNIWEDDIESNPIPTYPGDWHHFDASSEKTSAARWTAATAETTHSQSLVSPKSRPLVSRFSRWSSEHDLTEEEEEDGPVMIHGDERLPTVVEHGDQQYEVESLNDWPMTRNSVRTNPEMDQDQKRFRPVPREPRDSLQFMGFSGATSARATSITQLPPPPSPLPFERASKMEAAGRGDKPKRKSLRERFASLESAVQSKKGNPWFRTSLLLIFVIILLIAGLITLGASIN